MIKQVYAPYTQWEDWQNGMYRDVSKDENARLVSLAVELLTNPSQLKLAMQEAVRDWRVAAAVNLTDLTKNHRPWLGQAACCIRHRCTEIAVREAWNSLSSEAQKMANLQADQVFEVFISERSTQLTFGF